MYNPTRVVVKKTSQSSSVKETNAKVKYIIYRSQEIEKDKAEKVQENSMDDVKNARGHAFDRNGDDVNYKDFMKKIIYDKALQHPKSVKSHSFVFSLSGEQYSKFTSMEEYKEVIRETIESFEKHKRIGKTDYIASVHLIDGKGKKTHPHIHVIFSGTTKIRDTNKSKRLFFTKDDFEFLRNSFEDKYISKVGPEKVSELYHEHYQKEAAKDVVRSMHNHYFDRGKETKEKTNYGKSTQRKGLTGLAYSLYQNFNAAIPEIDKVYTSEISKYESNIYNQDFKDSEQESKKMYHKINREEGFQLEKYESNDSRKDINSKNPISSLKGGNSKTNESDNKKSKKGKEINSDEKEKNRFKER